jgi:tripartite-type tricarboxylate transporter receptor subunit TctC
MSSVFARLRRTFAPLAAALFAAALLPAGGTAHAQGFPNKPVRIVVPFTTGGAADTLARLVGQRLSEMWGQQVIVENRGGAGGTIGMDAALKMPADGYTFVLISNSLAVSQVLYPKLPYDLVKDFVPVNLVASTPMVLAVHPKVPVNSFAEFTQYVKARPGKLSYGSCGVGTAPHLAMEMYKFQTQSFVVHIPYRGCSVAATDAIGGQLDAILATAPAVLPHARQGKLKMLAVTNPARTPTAPEVPTMGESGVPGTKGFAVDNWYGFMAARGTPREAIDRLDADVRKVLAQKDIADKLAASGVDVMFGSAQDLAKLIDSDMKQFGAVIKFAGIKPE